MIGENAKKEFFENKKQINWHELMEYLIKHNPNAIAVHDKELRYLYVSDRYVNDYKVNKKDIIGKHHYEVFPDVPEKWRKVHKRALEGEVISCEEDTFLREDGSIDYTRWQCRPWHHSDGKIGGIVLYTEVITERIKTEEKIKKALKEKETLLKEVHHRVKNNFQTVNSLLNLHRLKIKDEKTLSILNDAKSRIKAMSLVHEKLYEANNLDRIKLDNYMNSLIENLVNVYSPLNENAKLNLELEKVEMGLNKALPLGLVLNEIITNAIKHGLKNTKYPELNIKTKKRSNTLSIIIKDNGGGLPEGFDVLQVNSLGWQLIPTLINELDGDYEVENNDGLEIRIHIPIQD